MSVNDQEKYTEKLFLKVLEGIRHVHDKKVVHGDIKLTNMMIDSNRQVRIIDFGYSSCLSSKDDMIANYSGTPVYLAPEIIRKIPYNGKIQY